jgi:hypothetical protein
MNFDGRNAHRARSSSAWLVATNRHIAVVDDVGPRKTMIAWSSSS